jgi:quinolinate synthetase A subunit
VIPRDWRHLTRPEDTPGASGTGQQPSQGIGPHECEHWEHSRARHPRRDRAAAQGAQRVILAHYYQTPELQDLADFIGDSLDLSRKAAATDADVIAFCGVRFMAETAKILSPDKIVVLPDMDAGCSLEDSCPPDQFAAFRARHPDHIALTYINCSTEVKALSDIIVTSSSAETILSQIPKDQPIIFGPDKNLGGWLNRKFGARCCSGRACASSTRPFRRPSS